MTAQFRNTAAFSRRQISRPEKITQLSRRQSALQQSQKKSERLTAKIPGLIYQFLLRQDGSLSFLFLSSSCQEFFEVESGEMELETETLISMLHPDDREDFYQSITEAAEILQSWRWVGRFSLPSGQTKWIQWDAQPSLQANGNIFWNGLLVDVTRQYELQAEVERLSFLLGLTGL